MPGDFLYGCFWIKKYNILVYQEACYFLFSSEMSKLQTLLAEIKWYLKQLNQNEAEIEPECLGSAKNNAAKNEVSATEFLGI